MQQNGRIIPGTCASYVIGCTSGHYIDNGTPGGNGGPSADGCEPCAQPGTGDQVPCSSSNGISSGSDKLSGIGPPTGCATDPCDYENPPAYCSADPCETGNDIIDDPKVQQGLNKLWNNTNYGLDDNPNPESQRKEQGGFIVSDHNGGYTFQQIPESATSHTPCTMTFDLDKSSIPDGAIYVHTHPYSNGEIQNNCPTPRPVKYRNNVGVKDRRALRKMGVNKGIIIDANGYTFYKKNGTDLNGYKKEDRCGY